MKSVISILFLTLFLVACGEEYTPDQRKTDKTSEEAATPSSDDQKFRKDPNLDPNVVVAGQIEGGAKTPLIVEANTNQGAVIIAKGNTDEQGKFRIQGNIEDFGLYQLRIEENVPKGQEPRVVPMTLVPDDSVYIDLTFNNFNQSAHYSGTEWSKPLNRYMKEMRTFVDWQKSIENPRQYDQQKLMKMVMKQKKPMDDFIVNFIEDQPANPVNILLMTNLMPMMGYENYDEAQLEVLQKMYRAYEEEYPEHPMTNQVGKQVTQVENDLKEFKSFNEEKIAPEIAMENPQGETMKLSDLKGKYVLIDFWASWCGPCRKENPNVVRLYNKYKDENFEIFSVSLDKNKEKWKRAIKADGLVWNYHVSDLKGWESDVVSTYQFRGIPHTVMVDPEGKIIATKLRGPSLEQKLKELFGK